MSDWASTFYAFQHRLKGCYGEPLHPYHQQLASRVTQPLGGPSRVPEVGQAADNSRWQSCRGTGSRR